MVFERNEVAEQHLSTLAEKVFGQLTQQTGTLHSPQLQRNLTGDDVRRVIFTIYGLPGTDPGAMQAAELYSYRLAREALGGRQGSYTDELAGRLKQRLPQLLERCMHEAGLIRGAEPTSPPTPQKITGT